LHKRGEVYPCLFCIIKGCRKNKPRYIISNNPPPNPKERGALNWWSRLLKFVFFSNDYFKKKKIPIQDPVFKSVNAPLLGGVRGWVCKN
jgi:hypothetical protein